MKYAELSNQENTVIFEVAFYSQHTESNEYEWANLNTIYAPSSLQFFGTETQNINLSVKFHREFCDPISEYETLKVIANAGKPAKLIVAEKVIGDFVIKKIDVNFQQIDVFGNPVLIEANLELQEYIQKTIEKAKAKTKSTKKKGKAVNKKKANIPDYVVVTKTTKDGYTYVEIQEKKK